jgi:hypothetical protein
VCASASAQEGDDVARSELARALEGVQRRRALEHEQQLLVRVVVVEIGPPRSRSELVRGRAEQLRAGRFRDAAHRRTVVLEVRRAVEEIGGHGSHPMLSD